MSDFDVSNDKGLEKLDQHLLTKSYIGGYVPSKSDVTVFEKFTSAPAEKYVNALRWYNHIASFNKEETGKWGEIVATEEKKEEKKEVKQDEDLDLFGGEEEDEEAKKDRERREEEAKQKKEAEGGKKKKQELQNHQLCLLSNLGTQKLIWLSLNKK